MLSCRFEWSNAVAIRRPPAAGAFREAFVRARSVGRIRYATAENQADGSLGSKSPIRVGVVGLRAHDLSWDEIDVHMKGRTRVVAVWDPVHARTAAVARQADRRDGDRAHFAPKIYRSVTRLAEHKGLEAAVVLDAGWTGLWSARCLAEEGIPVLWLADWPRDEAWSFKGAGRDLIVPGLRHRYCPATIRLREILAEEQASPVVSGPVAGVSEQRESVDPLVAWEFHDWLRCLDAETASDLNEPPTEVVVRLESSSVHWSYPDRLRRVGDDGETLDQELSDYRPAAVLLLDIFFRRVVGGLVPVPSVDDVVKAIE